METFEMISICMDKETKQELDKLASEYKISRSSTIRMLLNKYIKQEKKEGETQ